MPIERILYGGTYTLLDVSLRRLGIDTTFVPANQPEALAVVIRSTTRAFPHVGAFAVSCSAS